MKVLMLCIEFPPVNTTGNYRSAGFARYFSQNDVKTIVLTCDVESGMKTFNKDSDDTLMKGLENVKIYRFPIRLLSKFWTTGNADRIRIWWNNTDKIDKRWYSGVNKMKIDEIILKESPDLMYVSLPPFSMSRTAMRISRKFNLPLVTDMRDAWSLWVTIPFSSRLHYYKLRKLERKLFNCSSLILSVTPELANDFRKQHPHIEKEKFKTIYNGYDIENSVIARNIAVDTNVFRIGYIGSFYFDPNAENVKSVKWYRRKGLRKLYYTPRKEEWIYRSPYFFLKSLSLLFEKKVELKSKVYFEFIGSKMPWLETMVKDLSLGKNFISHGFRPKSEVLEIQSSWNAILATSEKVEGGEHFCLPSKIFDGVVSGKPILAFVTPGSQTNFLKEYEQVSFFLPNSLEENAKKLEVIINNNGKQFKSSPLSNEFTREFQAKKLLNHLYDLLDKKNHFSS